MDQRELRLKLDGFDARIADHRLIEVANLNFRRGFQIHSFARLRDELLQQGKLSLRDGVLNFEEDVLFTSPSGASAVACGAACNG
jgi:hypothetical protein